MKRVILLALLFALPSCSVVEKAEDGSALCLGELELCGLRYPVKAYQEPVSWSLWRGSRLSSEDAFEDLRLRGFKATVDLTREGTGDFREAPLHGLASLNVPILDNSHPTDEQMVTFLRFVTDPAHLPVYVHCEAGIGRTGIAVAVYRMAVLGWKADAALSDARAHGLKLPNQVAYIEHFGKALEAGLIDWRRS